jgi:hypothetical protein
MNEVILKKENILLHEAISKIFDKSTVDTVAVVVCDRDHCRLPSSSCEVFVSESKGEMGRRW